MSVMVIDSGNSIIKAKIARRDRNEITFPHAFQQLSESEYGKIISRVHINGNTQDYFRVNGKPYVVGESAERHGINTQRSGTARYTKDYCGVLAAISLSKLYGWQGSGSVCQSSPWGCGVPERFDGVHHW